MRGFLLDTNVVSEFSRPRPTASVMNFLAAHPTTIFISEIVLAELMYGVEKVSDRAKAEQLSNWINRDVRSIFAGRVIASNEASFLCWRKILALGRARRETYSEPDTILAATAQSHGLIVATRDWKPFERVGTPTIDPWKSRYRKADGSAPLAVDLTASSLLSL